MKKGTLIICDCDRMCVFIYSINNNKLWYRNCHELAERESVPTEHFETYSTIFEESL